MAPEIRRWNVEVYCLSEGLGEKRSHYEDRQTAAMKHQDEGLDVPPFYLPKHHPILCGLMSYWLGMEIRELGVALAMTYKTILSTAHLYNATRQFELLPVACWDMEYLISTHKAQHLFVGGLPTTLEGCFKQFRLAFEVNVANFGPNRRSSRLHVNKNIRSQRNIEKMYPLYSVFRGRYCPIRPSCQSCGR